MGILEKTLFKIKYWTFKNTESCGEKKFINRKLKLHERISYLPAIKKNWRFYVEQSLFKTINAFFFHIIGLFFHYFVSLNYCIKIVRGKKGCKFWGAFSFLFFDIEPIKKCIFLNWFLWNKLDHFLIYIWNSFKINM